MQLSPRQRRSLTAICDTFAPGVDGVPSASALGVPDAIAAALDANPREAERRQFGLLLTAFDTGPITALGGGGFAKFSALPHERREAVLRRWAASRLPQQRGVFHALRRAVLVHYYGLPGPDGGRNPVWDAIEYPGPLGRNPDAPPKALRPAEPEAQMSCDVVIVGSGAGGGTMAGVLAQAGLDVIVVEAGDYYDDEDFDGGELEGLRRMYLNGGGAATEDGSIALAAGACLGGGTVINYSTSFPTPDHVRQEWASHGVSEFAGEAYERSSQAVMERLGANSEHSAAAPGDAIMERGMRALGFHVEPIVRNVGPTCDQGVDCGRCGFGCRRGAKRSTVKTWLQDAHDAGARLLVRTKVRTILVEAGAARGVEARTVDGRSVRITARGVVSAAGALHTPPLLKRSGLQNRTIGKHLRLHPVTVVWGVFDEDVEPWVGTMQARYSDEHADLDGEHYGVKYETGPINPSLFLPFLPWRDARQHFEAMAALKFTTGVGVLLRDKDGGEVKVGKDGEPVVRYKLSPTDTKHMRAGVEGGARIMEAAGAQKIFASHAKLVEYRPQQSGSLASFMADSDAAGYGQGQLSLGSFHIMGSARMGGSPATSACTPEGETWEVRNLWVGDASAFPTAPGVNPMISIESVAHMNAQRIAARLGA
jgi:long-chain-alcohol oxidase